MHEVGDEDLCSQVGFVVCGLWALVLYPQLSILYWDHHGNIHTSSLCHLPDNEIDTCNHNVDSHVITEQEINIVDFSLM